MQSITIDENCISISTENSNVRLTKEIIYKIQYDKAAVYIFVGLRLGHIMTKKFLENENDFKEMVAFIKSNYTKPKSPRRLPWRKVT